MKELLFIATILCWFVIGLIMFTLVAVFGTLIAVAALLLRIGGGLKGFFRRWVVRHRSRLRLARDERGR